MFLSVRSAIGGIAIGVKRSLAYPLSILGLLVRSSVLLLLFTLVWNGLVSNNADFLPYFIVAYFFIIPVWWTWTAEEYTQNIREGWTLTITKPLTPFLYHILAKLGELFIEQGILIIAGLIVAAYFGVTIHIITLIEISIILLIWRVAEVYFLSSPSYFVYSTWGISVGFRLTELFLGGLFFPLNLLPSSIQNLLSYIPFYHSGYVMIKAVLTGNLPLFSVAYLLGSSLLLIIIGYGIHKAGWRHFESQGG